MSIKSFFKKVLSKLFSIVVPIGNYIVFESSPGVSDNPLPVFELMLKNGINNKFRLIWALQADENIKRFEEKYKDYDNVIFISQKSFLYRFFYSKAAKAFIVSNLFLERAKREQLYFDLSHGGAMKDCSSTYNLPLNCQKDSYVMTLSEYSAKYDAESFKCDISCMHNLGYPRNDALFIKRDIHKFFDGDYKKIIYWLPTYRQHKTGDNPHSNISFPVMNSEETAKIINECCRENGVLIVVKPHPVQDISLIKNFNLSNIRFINGAFLDENGISNYQFLGNCDALLSDYSTVYYDFLLCDKPIGLCWDDFHEYNKRVGFSIDTDRIFAGGVKIYNATDLCAFIKSVSEDEDTLKAERNQVKELVHDHIDDKATQRVYDFIMERIC